MDPATISKAGSGVEGLKRKIKRVLIKEEDKAKEKYRLKLSF